MANGIHDSSNTRVQPVVRQLYLGDCTGQTWLAKLLSMGTRSSTVLGAVANAGWTGALLQRPRPLFPSPAEKEWKLEPPLDYLRWLVQHPERLCWPMYRGFRRTYRAETQAYRQALWNAVPQVQQAALEHLYEGCRIGGWWTFEGRTSLDCILWAENVTVVVEGKRTEPHLTAQTHWDAQRHQVFRNLDCLQALKTPQRAKHFYMLLIVEEKTPPAVEADALDANFAVARNSWPRLSDERAQELWQHYLGFTTWQKVAAAFNDLLLPETSGEAALICPELRL